MTLKTVLSGHTYEFKDVKDVLARANEQKSGDAMAGLAARSDSERIAAKEVLSNLLLSDLRENPAVPYEEDEVTRLIQDGVDEEVYASIRSWSVAELREKLRHLLNFKFKKHSRYNMPENRLRMVERQVQRRAQKLLEL